ncbi:MAG: pantetheine-phosphate adenylyltransferase [Thermoanaerobaculaceae bacterium]
MSSELPVAVYPGSFDPLHMGHVDIVNRAVRLFPKVIVAVLENVEKKPLLSVSERVELARKTFAQHPRVSVASFSGLLVEFMRTTNARVILRGMRAVSDFEYEFQMALMNRRLCPEAETVFLTPQEEYTYLSSRVIKEIWALGGNIRGLVPPQVLAALERLRNL